MKKIVGQIGKADFDFEMIENNDRIAVGISGGKDSTLLLYGLYLYQQKKIKSFEIIPIHLKMGFPNMDMSELSQWFEQLGLSIITVDTTIYDILQLHPQSNGRLPCSLCSRFKKGYVIDEARKHQCNKIAFAHHGDDAIETLFMNMIFGGRVATFRPKMILSRANVTFIRPFVYTRESEIIAAVERLKIPILQSSCPNNSNTERSEMKKILHQMYENYPMAKKNFLKMIHNDEMVDLWHPDSK